jgi:hypothetical protein
MLGQCRLCLEMKDLVESHFLSAGLWKGARTPGLKNPNPVAITKKITRTTSTQIKKHLLCGECEERFNKGGECEALRWIAPGASRFPIADRLNVAYPHESNRTFKKYSGSAVGICTETLAYFALSILWRGAVRSWHLPDGSGMTSRIDLGANEEEIRKYLSGSPFPKDVVVVLTVCTDGVSRQVLTTPTQVSGSPYNKYYLLTQGLRFDILVDSRLTPDIRQLCCASSYNKWIFVANCEDQTKRLGEPLIATSKVSRSLARVTPNLARST